MSKRNKPEEQVEASPEIVALWTAYAGCDNMKANKEDKVVLRLIATGILEYFISGLPDEHKEMQIKQFAADAIINGKIKSEITDYEISLVAGTGSIVCKKDDVTISLRLFDGGDISYEVIEGDEDKAKEVGEAFLDIHTGTLGKIYDDTISLLSGTTTEEPTTEDEASIAPKDVREDYGEEPIPDDEYEKQIPDSPQEIPEEYQNKEPVPDNLSPQEIPEEYQNKEPIPDDEDEDLSPVEIPEALAQGELK